VLSLNEQNKYTYFAVKPAPPQPNSANLAAYLKKMVTGVEFLEATNKGGVLGRGIVLVYKQGLITGQEEGHLAYNVSIDFKDNKYRFILTDFKFTPYQRNRFGVFAPVSNFGTPIEKLEAKISTKQLNAYLDKLGSYSAKFNEQVSNFLTNPAPVKAKPTELKKVDTKNW
jgi:hypothetical protein